MRVCVPYTLKGGDRRPDPAPRGAPKEVVFCMIHHEHAQDPLALLAPAPAVAPPIPLARGGGATFRLLMRDDIAAGVALAGAMDEKESAAAVARTEAELARFVYRRDRDLAVWQRSRAAASRLVEEAGKVSF